MSGLSRHAPGTGDSAGPSPAARQAAARIAEFRNLRARGALCTEVSERLATEAAESFLSHYRAAGEYLSDAVSLLAEIAASEEPCLAQPGQLALFPLLVERLSDSFEPELCDLYDRVFAQLIMYCRTLPAGDRLDAALKKFGLLAEKDFLERKARLRQRPPWRDPAGEQAVRKVLVLSRVTLGADVAVTSIVLQKVGRLFPEAQRILLAPPKTHELLGGDDSLDICEVPYRSGGTLIERLESWLDMIAAVERETANSDSKEYILLDPDSRYLQLGLLPVLQDESRYFFFESRRVGADESKTLSQLTSEWLEEIFGGRETILPHVALRRQDQEFGRRVRQGLQAGGARWIVAISFGVGGNSDKRLPAPFEVQLLARLIEEGCTIVLDRGAGEAESAQAERLAELIRNSGRTVVELSADSLAAFDDAPRSIRCSVLTWQGGIGTWAGLIAASDEYIGYDSAGQHIAAALGVPTVSVFSSNASTRFRQRWWPTGPGRVEVITEADRAGGTNGTIAVLNEVLRAHREIRTG